jgi:DNA-binding MarR family transcriptional regulator
MGDVVTNARHLVDEWRELLARHARVNAALERELQARHGLSVTEFEALQRLAEKDEDGCRLQQLVDDVHMSQSALSRLITRLEQRGLVDRRSCETDRRGMFACLTQAGRDLLAEAEPTQAEVLARVLAGDAARA